MQVLIGTEGRCRMICQHLLREPSFVYVLSLRQKTVAGTLLVTPNAVMFDPDVLDPLVKEHGIEQYGLIVRYGTFVATQTTSRLSVSFQHGFTRRHCTLRRHGHV